MAEAPTWEMIAKLRDEMSPQLKQLQTTLDQVGGGKGMKETHEGLSKLEKVAAPLGRGISQVLTPALKTLGIAGLGASAIFAGLTEMSSKVSKTTVDMKLLADQTKMTVDQVERLQEAGKRAGISDAEVQSFERNMSRIANGFNKGPLGSDAKEAKEFADLMIAHGETTKQIYIDARKFHEANPDDTYGFILKVIDGIERLPPDQKAILLGDLGLAPQFAKLREKIDETGPIFHDDIEAAKAYKKSVDDISQAWDNLSKYLIQGVRPVLTSTFTHIADEINNLVFDKAKEGARGWFEWMTDLFGGGKEGRRKLPTQEQVDEYLRTGKVPADFGGPPAAAPGQTAPAAPSQTVPVAPLPPQMIPAPAASAPIIIPAGPPSILRQAPVTPGAPAVAPPLPIAPGAAPPIAPPPGVAPPAAAPAAPSRSILRTGPEQPGLALPALPPPSPSIAPIVPAPIAPSPGMAPAPAADLRRRFLGFEAAPAPVAPELDPWAAPQWGKPGTLQDLRGGDAGGARLDRALGPQTGMSTVNGTGKIDIDIKRADAGVPGVPPSMFRQTEMNQVEQMGVSDTTGETNPGGETFSNRWGK